MRRGTLYKGLRWIFPLHFHAEGLARPASCAKDGDGGFAGEFALRVTVPPGFGSNKEAALGGNGCGASEGEDVMATASWTSSGAGGSARPLGDTSSNTIGGDGRHVMLQAAGVAGDGHGTGDLPGANAPLLPANLLFMLGPDDGAEIDVDARTVLVPIEVESVEPSDKCTEPSVQSRGVICTSLGDRASEVFLSKIRLGGVS